MLFTFSDIDECDNNPCDGNASCSNNNGSYSCECDKGYSGDGYECTNYCEYSNCDVDQTCSTLPDNFQCLCKDKILVLVNETCTLPGSNVDIIGLTLNRVYIADYADNSSLAYKGLAAEIESEMLELLQSSNETSNSSIFGVRVTALRNGSVLADMTVAGGAPSLSVSSVQSAVNNGIANGNLSPLDATGSVTVEGIIFCYCFDDYIICLFTT